VAALHNGEACFERRITKRLRASAPPRPSASAPKRVIFRSRLSFAAMDEPEYLICLQCETPTYQFEITNGKVTAIVCGTCGNDDISEFMTEAELEELA
ncbi:MAG TPA: hypothetical protein VF911_17660, partial [Thermoanaerobaculia bacterium]